MEAAIISTAAPRRKEITTFKSGIWRDFLLSPGAGWRTMPAMHEEAIATRSQALAVIMERTALTNRWISEKWEAKGIVPDSGGADATPRVIVEHEGLTQMLFPGLYLQLKRDEAEGYFLNLTSPDPKVFVLWRMVDEVAKPVMITASYGEGTRWADSGEQVDGVPLPVEIARWLAQYVEANYRPEPPNKKRYASSKDRGRMGRIET